MNEPSKKRFNDLYEVHVVDTGRKVARYLPVSFITPIRDSAIQKSMTVPILSIEIPEDEYERFMDDYQNYLDIMDQLGDPIVRGEYYKLLVLAKLKK